MDVSAWVAASKSFSSWGSSAVALSEACTVEAFLHQQSQEEMVLTDPGLSAHRTVLYSAE